MQTLLDIREAREKEIQGELAVLLSIQNLERAKQEEFRNKITAERDRFTRKVRSGDFSYRESMMFERYVEFAHTVIESAQRKIDSMEGEIARVREKLVEASREKKVVEKLREKKKLEHLYELNREIARENDDANQKLFVRKKIQQAM